MATYLYQRQFQFDEVLEFFDRELLVSNRDSPVVGDNAIETE